MDDLATNRAHWDALARIHGQDASCDTDAPVAGADLLGDVESAAVGDVAGLEVLHLQSHIAFDSICLARHGASVTCVGFSAGSPARARQLADPCVSCDIDAWFAGACRVLRPGRRGALAELHPLITTVDGRGGALTREPDGRYRLRIDGEPLSVLFTLPAGKPA